MHLVGYAGTKFHGACSERKAATAPESSEKMQFWSDLRGCSWASFQSISLKITTKTTQEYQRVCVDFQRNPTKDNAAIHLPIAYISSDEATLEGHKKKTIVRTCLKFGSNLDRAASIHYVNCQENRLTNNVVKRRGITAKVLFRCSLYQLFFSN